MRDDVGDHTFRHRVWSGVRPSTACSTLNADGWHIQNHAGELELSWIQYVKSPFEQRA